MVGEAAEMVYGRIYNEAEWLVVSFSCPDVSEGGQCSSEAMPTEWTVTESVHGANGLSMISPKMVAAHTSAHSSASAEWIACLDKR